MRVMQLGYCRKITSPKSIYKDDNYHCVLFSMLIKSACLLACYIMQVKKLDKIGLCTNSYGNLLMSSLYDSWSDLLRSEKSLVVLPSFEHFVSLQAELDAARCCV